MLSTSHELFVLVADNDADTHQGADLCRQVAAEGYRWKLEAIIVPERGIAQVRNALVERALSGTATQFIAMLDDDEWPEPQWLEELLRVQAQTTANVVRGSVLRDFEIAPHPWSIDWEGIAPIRYQTGYSGMIEGIGNVLIARRCFEVLSQPYFDPQFGLTGGEDKDFFVRLRAAGARFTRAEDAVVVEHVPASRVRLGWSLLRAYRTGNCDMRIALKYGRGFFGSPTEVGKILAALVFFPVLSIAYCLSPTHRLDGLRKLYRAAGKIGALLGHRYYEYSAGGAR
jgi:glycosyltransferase involved in cell wall biosynthesis